MCLLQGFPLGIYHNLVIDACDDLSWLLVPRLVLLLQTGECLVGVLIHFVNFTKLFV